MVEGDGISYTTKELLEIVNTRLASIEKSVTELRVRVYAASAATVVIFTVLNATGVLSVA